MATSHPPSIVRLTEVDSTQEIAFAHAQRGAPDGTAIVADYQRSGRGRRGRVWLAAPGSSLLVSIIVRPRLAPASWPLHSFVGAIAAAETLEGLGVRKPCVSWPNDVVVADRKIAGVLLEARGDAGGVIVVGVGMNLRQREFPSSLRVPATSVRLETGTDVEREAALGLLLAAFQRWRDRLETDGFAPVRAQWLARATTIGGRVRVDDVEGVAVDIADDGALVVDDGTARRRVLAGDVQALRGEPRAS